MKILVAEKISDVGMEALYNSGFEISYQRHISREELLATIGEYEGLIVRSQPMVDAELLEKASKLIVVGRAGNGVDNIDMDAATNHGVIVVNTPDANSVSACELTIGMMLASCRSIPQANDSLKGGVWGRSRFQGTELKNKTLGIIGLGRIGTLLAKRMTAFGVKTIAYDPYITDEQFKRARAQKCETLHELLRQADIITIHTPKTSETFNMLGTEEFKLVKKGVRLVNCARGGIINEEALAVALADGTVASAACDVLVQEPCTDSPLYKFDNFIVTPHIGATTDEAQENVGLSVAEEVICALRGEMVPNAVNMPALKREDIDAVKPYMRLGELLGKIYHQLQKKPVKRVEIDYCGQAAQLDTAVITRAVLRGLFEPILKEQINYVNSRLVAESRGVSIAESKEERSYHGLNIVRVNVYAGERVYRYTGTIFGEDDPRITEIDGFRFDFRPEPHMLIVENADRPGMIGKIGTLMGENGINISTMQVSPVPGTGKAMMTIGISEVPKKEQLGKIEELENIFKVRYVNF